MFQELMRNRLLHVAITSWFIAQVIKLVLTMINERRFDITKLTSSGGMPSSHSSFTVALAMGLGQTYGYDSALFAIGAVFSFVVMYDAANVRLEAGKQATLLNKIVEHIEGHQTLKLQDFQLKELLGHTPIQVLAGAILGIVVALVSLP